MIDSLETSDARASSRILLAILDLRAYALHEHSPLVIGSARDVELCEQCMCGRAGACRHRRYENVIHAPSARHVRDARCEALASLSRLQ